ncbi:hypothetical protein BH11MYX1_BH11MYX1_01670 [soil metagenome]
MAKTESTAVNNLIELTQNNERTSKPIVHPDDDLFAKPPTKKQLKNTPGALPVISKPTAAPSRMTGNLPAMTPSWAVLPLPRTRAAGGTSQLTLPDPQVRIPAAPAPRATAMPPIPPSMSHRPSAPVFATTSRISEPVFTARLPGTELDRSPDTTGDLVRAEPWFEVSRAVEKFDDQTYVGTSPHVKYDRSKDSLGLVKKLILPAIAFIVIGAMIGGFIAFSGDKKQPRPVAAAAVVTPANAAHAASVSAHAKLSNGVNAAKTRAPSNDAADAAGALNAPNAPDASAAQPARVPAAAPEAPSADVHEIQTTRGVVKLVDVRIDSKPGGATVTLVEHTPAGDKRSFLGSTPIATSVDPTHQFEVELELAGHAMQTTHLDPAKATRVSFDFKRASKPVAAAPVSPPAVAKATAPVVHHQVAAAQKPSHSAPVASLADPFEAAPAGAPATPPTEPATGTLMLSSKPPCTILVDGKPTGLSTLQRAIELPAGAQKITLVNEAAGINKTVMVQITAGQPTKLVRDLIAN